MQVCKTIALIRQQIISAKRGGMTVGFVPTMGALHKGHTSLIEKAKKSCDFVVVSIFVNPTQFEPGSDYQSYPRTIDDDLEQCRNSGADAVFIPDEKEMYCQQQLSWVTVNKISEPLCGKSRVGHFCGVATVCTKLFNIIGADKAFFGQKDAQQLAVIKRMVSDLNVPIEIIGCTTIREDDGLAMSSRNKYLSQQQRTQAPLVYAALQLCQVLVNGGENNIEIIKTEMVKLLTKGEDIKIDYIEFVDPDTMEQSDITIGKTLVAIAVKLGKARLIDNLIV